MDPDPTFTHDCDDCTFLGTVQRTETIIVTDAVAEAMTRRVVKPTLADLNRELGVKPMVVFDLYHCPAGLHGGSVIARYGDDGPDYKSVPLKYAYVNEDPELTLATEMVHRLARGR